MAKTSMIVKQQKHRNFPLAHTTGAKSAADPMPIFGNLASAVSASENWLTKARSRA